MTENGIGSYKYVPCWKCKHCQPTPVDTYYCELHKKSIMNLSWSGCEEGELQ